MEINLLEVEKRRSSLFYSLHFSMKQENRLAAGSERNGLKEMKKLKFKIAQAEIRVGGEAEQGHVGKLSRSNDPTGVESIRHFC